MPHPCCLKNVIFPLSAPIIQHNYKPRLVYFLAHISLRFISYSSYYDRLCIYILKKVILVGSGY